MTGKQLLDSILKEAIQGRLVPQDPNDELASVLLDNIRQEKAKLVEEGKIKKSSITDSTIYKTDEGRYYERIGKKEIDITDEIPFDIPQGWEWSRMNVVANLYTGDSINEEEKKSKYTNVLGKEYIGTKDISFDHIVDYKNGVSIPDKYILNFNIAPAESILLCIEGGSAGRKIAQINQSVCFGNKLCCFNFYDFAISKYVYYYLQSPSFFENFKENISGIIGGVSMNKLRTLLLPIPPLAEQKRIVEKIEEIMPLVEKYAWNEITLEKINTNIKPSLKKSILQEAIQGRLVPQDPNDELASVLLDNIRQEKAKLVEEGKIKKSSITDSTIYKTDEGRYYERIGKKEIDITDEIPFAFPETWSITRLSTLCLLSKGQKQKGKGVLLDAKYLRGKSDETIIEGGQFVYKGENIILVDGENSGEVFEVPQDGYMGSTFKLLCIFSAMYKPYLLAFIRFYKEMLRNSKKGAAIPHLNKELFYNLIVGIPPLAEQKRIVEKIEEIEKLLG